MVLMRLFDLPDESVQNTGLQSKHATCISCGLYKDVKSPRMPPFGDFHKNLMIIGEGPGKIEDQVGRPWQGPAGELLRRTLRSLGANLDNDCLSTNTVLCRPPENRAPTPHEAACCRARYTLPTIQREKPRVVLLLGGAACASIAGSLTSTLNDTITKWRGFKIPVPEWGCWLCPTFHPSFVLRCEDKPEVTTIWERDLEEAIAQLKVPVPAVEDLRSKVVLLKDESEIVAQLNRVRRGWFSHDYETTGLRAECHDLVSGAWAVSPEQAFAFTFPLDVFSPVYDAWRNILGSHRIEKIAHNIKFENEWGRQKFGEKDIKWGWDSMLAAHVIDNRPGICGLKLQSFLQLGVQAYDDAISSYLESENSNDPASKNNIHKFIERFGVDEELVYNGLDALLGLRLSLQQMEILRSAV